MHNYLALLTALIAVSPYAVNAQDGHSIGGGFNLASELKAEGYFNDNFYSQARDKEPVFGAIFRPSGRILSDRGRLKLGLRADSEFGVFERPTDNDDYIDSTAEGGVEYLWSTLHRTTFAATHVQGHDPFGVQRTEAQPSSVAAELDIWHSDAIKSAYRYGSRDAPVNIEFSFNAVKKHYDSNQAQTSHLNNTNMSARSEIFYNYSPKTAAVLEASGGKVYFSDPSPAARARNGTTKSILLGLRWSATAQTTGDARVGYMLRNFDGTPDRRFQAINWSAVVTWAPVPLTSVKLITGRAAQDSYTNARFIDNLYSLVQLNQKFSDRLDAGLRGGYTRSKFVEATPGRTDDVYSAGVNASYLLSKALSLIAAVNYVQRESTYPVFFISPTNIFDLDYDATTVLLGFRYTP